MERLYGRADAIALGKARLARATRGQGGLLLFTGEPGIGKSRVAEELAAAASAAGAVVAWGRCWEAGGAPPYWPWIQVFRQLGMESDPFAGITTVDAGGNPEQARFLAFDLAVQRLRAAAEQRPLVIVLDDLHAADVPSLLLLLMLVRALRGSSLLVIGAHRVAELRLLPEGGALLAKIAREAEVLPLARLSPQDVAAWVAEAAPATSAEQAQQLYRVTEGHPLFLVEALRLGVGAQAKRAVLEGLSAVLDERLALLPPEAHQLLRLAAVLGRELSARDLVAVSAQAPDEVDRALRAGAAASIIVGNDDPDQWRFSHVLLRDRLYAELPPSVRAALHWKAGQVLLARDRDHQAAVFHLFEGREAGDLDRLVEVAHAAAEGALRRLAFEDATRLAERALALVNDRPPTRLIAQLRLMLAEASIRLGAGPTGRRACVQAADMARALGAGDLLVRAALIYGIDLQSGQVDPTMVALLREALTQLDPGDSAVRARVTARLAAALSPPETSEGRQEIWELMASSVAMARRVGDRHNLLHVLPFAAASVGFLVPEEERALLMRETVQLARALDQPLVLTHSLPTFITGLLGAGQRREAEVALAELTALLARFPQPAQLLRLHLLRALLHALDGDFAAADRQGEEAWALVEAEGTAPARSVWLFHRFSLAHLRGRRDLPPDEAAAVLAFLEPTPIVLPFAAWLNAGTGQRALAEQQLAATEIQAANLVALLGAAEACVALGDVTVGQRVYPLAVAAAGQRPFCSLSPGALLGPLARILGELALLLGKPVEAARHLEQAVAAAELLGAGWLAERSRRLRDQALAATGEAPPPANLAQPAAARPRPALRRDGEMWALVADGGEPIRLKHSKGLGYLRDLLEQPGREIHVLELVGAEHATGDAGVVLDPRAKAAYRARLDDLKDEREEAERFGDVGRLARAEQEIQAIAEQLAGAVGLGGRDRRAASDVERARINVQRRLKDAIDRIGAAHPALGRYLTAAIRTGTYCAYHPI